MTSFVAWVGVDSRGTSSINFASDSRISWKHGHKYSHWDCARKTFSCASSPDIFGYVNDVTFPSIVLSQIVVSIDSGVLFENGKTSSSDRFRIVAAHIKSSFKDYSENMKKSFSIFHGSRNGEKMKSKFHLYVISWSNKSKKWSESEIKIPNTSSVIKVDGSGSRYIDKWVERWDSTSQKNTSRAIFSAFCDAVYFQEDKLTSGSPQLVSIHRNQNGKTFGYVGGGKKYISGTEILDIAKGNFENNEWRNRYFERCTSDGKLMKKAKQHHVPKGLGGNTNKINNLPNK